MRADEGESAMSSAGRRAASAARNCSATDSLEPSETTSVPLLAGSPPRTENDHSQLRSMIRARDRRICGGDRLGQIGGEPQPRFDELRSQRDELVIPHIQGGELFAADAADLRGLSSAVRCLSTRS